MSKFNVGDTVRCYRKELEEWIGFDFIGKVLMVKDDEYAIENAPCLIWEEEIVEKVKEAN